MAAQDFMAGHGQNQAVDGVFGVGRREAILIRRPSVRDRRDGGVGDVHHGDAPAPGGRGDGPGIRADGFLPATPRGHGGLGRWHHGFDVDRDQHMAAAGFTRGVIRAGHLGTEMAMRSSCPAKSRTETPHGFPRQESRSPTRPGTAQPNLK